VSEDLRAQEEQKAAWRDSCEACVGWEVELRVEEAMSERDLIYRLRSGGNPSRIAVEAADALQAADAIREVLDRQNYALRHENERLIAELEALRPRLK